MSTYLTDPSHIALLSIVAAKYGLGDPEKVAGILTQANLDSLTYRYEHHLRLDWDAAQDSTGGQYTNAQYIRKVKGQAQMGVMAQVAANIPLDRILGMISCLRYQSCEHAGYESSEAASLLDDLEYLITADRPIPSTGWELRQDEFNQYAPHFTQETN